MRLSGADESQPDGETLEWLVDGVVLDVDGEVCRGNPTRLAIHRSLKEVISVKRFRCCELFVVIGLPRRSVGGVHGEVKGETALGAFVRCRDRHRTQDHRRGCPRTRGLFRRDRRFFPSQRHWHMVVVGDGHRRSVGISLQMREARVGVAQGYREVLVRLIDGVFSDGNANVPGCLEAELAPHVCAREVALPEAEAVCQPPVVRAFGGGAAGRRRGQGDGDTALRHLVRRGGGPGLQGDRCRVLVNAHGRLVPADGDGYEVVVGDLYARGG